MKSISKKAVAFHNKELSKTIDGPRKAVNSANFWLVLPINKLLGYFCREITLLIHKFIQQSHDEASNNVQHAVFCSVTSNKRQNKRNLATKKSSKNFTNRLDHSWIHPKIRADSQTFWAICNVFSNEKKCLQKNLPPNKKIFRKKFKIFVKVCEEKKFFRPNWKVFGQRFFCS